MSMLQQPRTPRHYIQSPPPSSGRTPTPRSGRSCAPRSSPLGGQPEADASAAGTVADLARRDVPQLGSASQEAELPHERQRDQPGEQLREQRRQKLASTWCHPRQRPLVFPRRSNLSWFHGTRDEPLEFAPAVPQDVVVPSAASTAAPRPARDEASARDLPQLRPRGPSGRGTQNIGEEVELWEAPWPCAIPGYTGYVGGRGDGTFGLGLSTTRTRAVAMDRRRPFVEICGGTRALGRLLGAWGGAVEAPTAATGGKYSEGMDCRGGRASSVGTPEARSAVPKPAVWAPPRKPANSAVPT